MDASRTIGFKGDRPYSLNDVATLALMTEFYGNLRSAPIKAEALRKAQLAMIHKQILVRAC
ncbi:MULTISPECIES: CHAT domain-containing protein [unclassified Microcoleus]|uniref:CHAT domain-containing protein n=1 Tax=unclassified Microcoleus TaxID=2642155 RepID=UPI002FCE6FDC